MNKTSSTLTVDLKKLKENYLILCESSNNRIVAAVVKGNAYGLGIRQVSEALFQAGCRYFFVANWKEVFLIPQNIRDKSKIYSLVGPEPCDFEEVITQHVIPIFHRLDQVNKWTSQTTDEFGVQLNTSLNRLGLTEEEFKTLEHLNLSQLSCGYLVDYPENSQDLCMMKRIGGARSDASSCAFLLDQSEGMIRAGRGIYGIKTNDYSVHKKLQPVATLTSPIIQIRHVKPGEHVGYNRDYRVTRFMQIAIVNIGYASGYLVLPSLEQMVYSNNQFCKVISQSMDFTTIDVTGLDCKVADSVELFGPNIPQNNAHYRIRVMGNVRRVFINGEESINNHLPLNQHALDLNPF